MSSRKSNYNKISMLKSKVVKRALRFDRKVVIESMVKTMEGAKIHAPKDDDFNIDIPEIAREHEIAREYGIEIGTDLLEAPQQEEQQEEKKTDLFGGLDLDF